MGLRGSRTFAVRGGSRSPATYEQELYNNNIDIGGVVSFPNGEYAPNSRGLYPRAGDAPLDNLSMDTLDVNGAYKDETIGSISRLAEEPAMGGNKPDAVDLVLGPEDYAKDPEASGKVMKARMGAAALKTAGGVINAVSAHTNYVNANSMKIYQAQLQQNYIKADAARAILREGTKATDRKGQALISAVAQGQSASGDLAQTAMSNEDVYAAQNAMNIEINAMRAIYGQQAEILNIESNNRLSKINRNASIANSIIGGATSAYGASQGVAL